MERYPDRSRPIRRRATGLARSLVVAAATLAILLVCFTIYQYSQVDPESQARPPALRLPATPTEPAGSAPRPNLADVPGVKVGEGRIGPGRDIKLTLYPREGTRARLEIAVSSWTPIQGTTDEFSLADPEIRVRTGDGRAVRVTARRGVLEARRKGSGGLDAQRGRLTGDVMVQIDRLTEEERAGLPEHLRGRLDPAQLVSVTTEEIEFDLEYSKLVIPRGGLHLSAREVDFRADDLEIRFNEEAGRVEYLRINRGGRVELRNMNDELGLKIPGADPPPVRRSTIAGWLHTTLQAALDTEQLPEPVAKPFEPPVAMTAAEDGTPVFHPGVTKEERPRPPIVYLASFTKGIDVKQLFGEEIQSRLRADTLDIRRAFSKDDEQQIRATASAPSASGDPGARAPGERLVLNWSGRLVVEACAEDDDRCGAAERLHISARGAPVRIFGPEGDATCREARFDPDAAQVWLTGSESDLVTLCSAGRGTVTGVEVHTERTGTSINSSVTGPGRLVYGSKEVAATGSAKNLDRARDLEVSFSRQLDVFGRVETRTRLDLAGGLGQQQHNVIDRAAFVGDVLLTVAETTVTADALTAKFGARSAGGEIEQTIESVEGRGHVAMAQGDDRITCRDMDLSLSTDCDGRLAPVTLTALTDVEVIQDERTIRARDRLIVDFKMIRGSPPPFDAGDAYARAVTAGVDVSTIDWEKERRRHEAATRSRIGVSRLRGFGEVTVLDPARDLDLAAAHLDCTLVDGREIDDVVMRGQDGQPTSVRIDTFTVTGREIKLDVSEEQAEVPGAGRMAFRSPKDLDGGKVEEPIPISITWERGMKYHGPENRAVFSGNVHATSAATTTFDCQELLVEFDDVAPAPPESQPAREWWILDDLVGRVFPDEDDEGPRFPGGEFSKEPAYILATGQAVALTARLDPITGKLKSRARLSGPKLSVNLRPTVSRMLIEGAGNLLLEDFRPMVSPAKRRDLGLLAVDEGAGPSKTLIDWRESMSYDFSTDQTRFEGEVSLRYFSGAELDRILGKADVGGADTARGRSTFLQCDVLSVDFRRQGDPNGSREKQRMGRLSAERLRQFRAMGSVKLQDPTEGLALTADEVIYEKERDLLLVQGNARRTAHIVLQRPGQLPREYVAERFSYNLKTSRTEAARASFRGQ